MKNVTTSFRNPEQGILMSQVISEAIKKADAKALIKLAKDGSELTQEVLESYLGNVKILKGVDNKPYALFNTPDLETARETAERLANMGVFTEIHEFDGRYSRANSVQGIRNNLGFYDPKDVKYNDAKADQILESARIQR